MSYHPFLSFTLSSRVSTPRRTMRLRYTLSQSRCQVKSTRPISPLLRLDPVQLELLLLLLLLCVELLKLLVHVIERMIRPHSRRYQYQHRYRPEHKHLHVVILRFCFATPYHRISYDNLHRAKGTPPGAVSSRVCAYSAPGLAHSTRSASRAPIRVAFSSSPSLYNARTRRRAPF